MTVMKDTFNFVINQLSYSKRDNGSFYGISKPDNSYDFFNGLIKEMKDELNIINLKDILTEESQRYNYGATLEQPEVYDFYCKENAIIKEVDVDERKFSLILFNYFLDFKKIYGDALNETINNYNETINKHSLKYTKKRKFNNLAPLAQKNEKYGLLNFSKEVKKKYNYVNKEYEEAFNEYNKGQYKEAIWKAFVALESLVKIKLKEKHIDFVETDGFSKNIGIMVDHEIFSQFLVRENVISLSSIRNNHGAHGSSEKPVEDKDFTYFYLYNIANTLLYISKL